MMKIFPLFHRTLTGSSAKSSASSTSSRLDHSRNRSKASPPTLTNKGESPPCSLYDDEVERAPSAQTPTADFATENASVDQPPTPGILLEPAHSIHVENEIPQLTLETPTPDPSSRPKRTVKDLGGPRVDSQVANAQGNAGTGAQRPEAGARKQSLAHQREAGFLKSLVAAERPQTRSGQSDYFGGIGANMLHRKIWVKRPGASATLVGVNEDDLVDDVRDMILKKYANSLGRSFDAPDVTLRIVPRDHSHRHPYGERTLGPEEPICRTLDGYYPGGQTVDDALIIDVPQRRTPRHSPKVHMPYYLSEDTRPGESGTDYFPPMLAGGAPSPLLPSNLSVASGQSSHRPAVNSISILNTGQIPALPSPGGRGIRHSSHRPRAARTHTSSPTTISSTMGNPSDRSQIHINGAPAPPPLPSPPVPAEAVGPLPSIAPPPRTSSPRPTKAARKPRDKGKLPNTSLPRGLLDGAVPPINVLIVEDNIINLKLLEAFMKRLKVRWHTAMNGREAVNKWREGGFHLVLMDIQLPVMNGLEATKEIRRLERINGVGFGSGSTNASGRSSAAGGDCSEDPDRGQSPEGEDRFMNSELFKSPVIIVALTASSLQSDRHEALAAGCNDFLTKPVNFVWLERKVMEWGCMQALIDFDGWRKWKDFTQAGSGAVSNPASISSTKPSAPSLNTSSTTSTTVNTKESPKDAKAKKVLGAGSVGMPNARTGRKEKRRSLGGGSLSGVAEDGEEVGEEVGSGSGSGRAIAAGA